MNALSTKFAAFTAALLMNALIMSAVGYLFALQSDAHVSAIAFAKALVRQTWLS
jgi:hypothetical protein